MKVYLSTLLLILLTTSLSAQNSTFGFKIGPNYFYSNYEFDDPIGKYQFGAASNFKVYKFISIQTEFLFVKKAFEEPYRDSWEVKAKGSYFDIPVFIQVQPIKQLAIYSGGQIGFRLSHELKYNHTNNLYTAQEGSLEKVPLGLLAGLSIHPIKHWSLEGRYSIEIARSSSSLDFRGWQFFLNYTF
ncbi:outer membrane beta-barrel protein [Sunxiuqinia indica]|uniref:outer membrane beta-barrel protein n=1 Tax=Sunxiuqinia indica TaxID=2692584 RepID=UPI001357C8BA|nr:outer membrane beta-barrel protein [Sunxiuqinia indica]